MCEGKGTVCRLRRGDRAIWSFFVFEVTVMLEEYIVFNSDVLA